MKLDFRVSNLLNEDMLLYYTTAQRPPGGDITNPQRIARSTSRALCAIDSRCTAQ